MTGRKRGRPKSPQTLELERIDKMLEEAPDSLKMNSEQRIQHEEWLANLESRRLEILKEYKHGVTTPDEHAYLMDSLGHEMFQGYEQQILANDKRYAEDAKSYRRRGAATTAESSTTRKNQIIKKNKILIDKMNNSQTYTVNSVAQQIHKQWDSIPAAGRHSGEPSGLSARGDGGVRPAISTLRRWLTDC